MALRWYRQYTNPGWDSLQNTFDYGLCATDNFAAPPEFKRAVVSFEIIDPTQYTLSQMQTPMGFLFGLFLLVDNTLIEPQHPADINPDNPAFRTLWFELVTDWHHYRFTSPSGDEEIRQRYASRHNIDVQVQHQLPNAGTQYLQTAAEVIWPAEAVDIGSFFHFNWSVSHLWDGVL